MTAASENLLATYFAVGRRFSGAEVREAEGYVALLSDLRHPSGNFAVRLSLDPWSARELVELATSRPAFQAIALPDDAPEHLAELLRRAGFRLVQRLAVMEATPPFGLAGLDMAEAREDEARRRVGHFVGDVFFAREPLLVRNAIAGALADSPLALYAQDGRAAVSLSARRACWGSTTYASPECIGEGGVGASLVAWCLAQAAAESRTAVLQCAPALEPWYAASGFARTGSVTVWGL